MTSESAEICPELDLWLCVIRAGGGRDMAYCPEKAQKLMPIGDPDPHIPTRMAVGSRTLTGGAVAAFIGILLRTLGPDPVPGVPLNPHLLAYLFLGIGIFLLIVGLLARAFFPG